MYKIPGFEFIGSVDITQERYDRAGIAMFLWAEDGSGLYSLEATGCGCGSCGSCNCGMYDAMVPEYAELVEDLEEKARELHADVVASDNPDIPALRAMIIEAQKRMDWTRVVKAVQA